MVKKREAVIQVYVTPEEKRDIEAAAVKAGLSAAAFMRSVVLDSIARNVPPKSDAK